MNIKKEQASFEKLLIVCLLLLLAIGCGEADPVITPTPSTTTSENTPAATEDITSNEPSDTAYPANNQAQASGYIAPQQPSVDSVPIPDPDVIFPETDANTGVIGGILAREITDEGYVPVQPRELVLGKIIKNNLGQQMLISVSEDAQRAELFATGVFLFSQVPPGEYGIVIDLGFTQFPLLNENDEQILLNVEAGTTIDLGKVLVKIPED